MIEKKGDEVLKYIRQFVIILTIAFIGEVLKYLIPLQIPASIYGLILMLAALCLKIIPLDAVKDVGKFLIEVMPLMFIPAAVGLMESWTKISPILVKLIVIVVVSTVAVMAVAGLVTQCVIRNEQKRKKQ